MRHNLEFHSKKWEREELYNFIQNISLILVILLRNN